MLKPAASGYHNYLAYFLPLALQGMAQSLTYPLVAMIASRGGGGALNMAGLAQANAVFGIFWTLGMGITTAGMVFGKTREGFARCLRINNIIIIAVAILYLILMLPACSRWLFGVLLGLPPSIEQPAVIAYIASFPLALLFFMRTPYQVALFNNNATGRAFIATFGRIILALLLAPLFCWLNWVGPVWATLCMTLAVLLELLMSRYFALPFMRRLPKTLELPPSHTEILTFSLTLSLGALLAALSGFMMGAFIARALKPEQMLPVFYLVMGIVSMVAGGVARLQALIINYYNGSPIIKARLFKFTLAIGLLFGFLPLLFILPGLLDWYYIMLQKLQLVDLPLVRGTTWAMFLYPLTLALRSYAEGLAAYSKKPLIILIGQIAYLLSLATVAWLALNIGVPGNLLGALAILLASSAAAAVTLFLTRPVAGIA